MTYQQRLRRAAGPLLVAIAALAGGSAEALSYRVERLLVPSGVAGLRTIVDAGTTQVLLLDTEGNAFRVGFGGDGLSLEKMPLPPPVAPDDEARLADGMVTSGDRGIHSAWLIQPTRRYAHGALGDDVEAGGVAAHLADGRVVRLSLGADAVFEDLTPRLADMDGDGRDEILLVKSTLERGAALAVIAPANGGLRIAAESQPLGQPNRWLNPIGTGDFDGDGRIEAAVVTTPHVGGTLRTYEMHAGRLLQDFALAGFSNHALGSRQLGLSAVLDVSGDGVPDLAVPGNDRRVLKVLTLASGRFRTLAVIDHGAAIATDVVVRDLDGNGRQDLIYALDNRFLLAVLWDE